MMERTPVTSSAIHSMAYDAVSQTMEVAWRKKGTDEAAGVYQFVPVDGATYNEILASDSIGARINKLKADPSVSCTRVEEESAA